MTELPPLLPTVLIVDDEPPIRRLLRSALERAGYAVREAGTAREALDAVASVHPAVVLLDLGLPDRDGMELVPILRQRTDATVLVVSAREDTDEKVAALDLGADDYVTKPFDTNELLARVRAALRHRLSGAGIRSVVTVGALRIDLVNREIASGGTPVHLTPKEYGVLVELAKYPGRVVTHDQLLKSVWPNEYERHVEYLRVVIRNLRQKIEPDPSRPAIVVSELRVGYRLMGADQ